MSTVGYYNSPFIELSLNSNLIGLIYKQCVVEYFLALSQNLVVVRLYVNLVTEHAT